MSVVISNYFNKKIALKKHLSDFGLIVFDNKYDYDKWSKEKIINSHITKSDKDKYLNYIKINNLKNINYLDLNFYNLIAKYLDLCVILHSMKSEDILISGFSASKSLLDETNILDLGCNVGYLSSFYSKLFLKSKVTGFDTSYSAIKIAKKKYRGATYKNLSFTSYYKSIKNNNYDFIVDTQCLCSLNPKELRKITTNIFQLLKYSGKLVSISSLSNEQEAHNFINNFNNNNLYVESMSEVLVNTIFGLKAYTKLVITKNKNNHIIEINNYYKKLREKISLLKVFDAFK